MPKNILIATIFSLIVGLGIGFSIGRSNESLSLGVKSMENNKMTSDLGAKDDKFDMRFIDEMTAHHNGAIDMATQAKSNSARPEIINLANEIIDAQTKEIDQMKIWRDGWYGNRQNNSSH